jgi:hypothetical protein
VRRRKGGGAKRKRLDRLWLVERLGGDRGTMGPGALGGGEEGPGAVVGEGRERDGAGEGAAGSSRVP